MLSATTFPSVLAPESPNPNERRALLRWLAVQQVFALRPLEAALRFAETHDPERLIEGITPERDPDGARRRLAAAGGRIVPYPSAAYPELLRRLSDPAPVLCVRGEVAALSAPCVAIVGARAATAYGREAAARIAAGLARAGVVVVSGLARGIDAVAHEAALAAGGRSVAVQACGLDQVYPAAHRSLAARIAGQGAVISEMPPGMPPLPAHFPLRNRLISGLSLAVVVVEARVRSGSLVTARHALDQGIEVLAVPGPITAPTSAGPNALLRDGASPALGAEDVLRAARLPIPSEAPPAAPRQRQIRDAPLFEALRDEPCTRDVLARRLGRDPGPLAAQLVELELAGEIVEDRDGRLWLAGQARGS